MEDWAEIRRLHFSVGMSIRAIEEGGALVEEHDP